MNRLEIESKLHRERARLLDAFAAMPEPDHQRGVTPSEHDPANLWSALDHLVHLSLIEHNFAAMVRRHVSGDANPVGLLTDGSGAPRTREQIMASVHEMTEEWQRRHAGKSLTEVVAIGAESRSVTLKLLSELTDEQLAETLPGAPWADGTVGGVLSANADHGRMHWQWVIGGFEARGLTPPPPLP